MINTGQLIAMIVVMVGCVVIITSPFIKYRKDMSSVLKIFFTGAMIYFVGDTIIRYMLLNLIQMDNIVLLIVLRSIVSVALAILFRVFVLKGVLNQERQEIPKKTGIVLGMGQIAMEAIFVLFNYIGNFQIALAINNGTIYDLISTDVSVAQVEEAIVLLENTPISDFLASLFLVSFYLIIQIGFSLMIINALQHMDEKQFALIIVLYLAFILSETILVSTEQTIMLRVAVVLVFALLMLYYIFTQTKKERQYV